MARNKLTLKHEVDYKSPLEIPYLKKIIFSLSTLGAWPTELGQKQWFSLFRNSKLSISISIMLWALCLKYLKNNATSLSFLDLGRNVVNCVLWTFMLQRVFSTKTKMFIDASKRFLNEMHLYYYRNKNNYAMKIYGDVEKIATYFTKILHFELYFGLVLYILTPLYNSFRRGMFKDVPPLDATFDHSVFYDLPFDYTTDIRGFSIVYFVNCFVCFDVATCFVALDLYISVIVFHLWGHLKLLQHNLRNFPKPAMKGVQSNSIINPPWFDEEESISIRALLIDSMEHYNTIKEFMDEVSMAFGATICVYYLLHQIIGCILLLEFTQLNPEALGAYGMLTITAFQQLIQMSVVFELIGTQSETIKDAVYEVPWECMDTINRKIVLTYLCIVQEPMNLKALGILPVGVRTMASIIKTSLSYFMLLRTSI